MERCDILKEKYTEKDIKGFVLMEVASDKAFCEEIYQQSGIDLRNLQEMPQQRLQEDEDAMRGKLEKIEGGLKEQVSHISAQPVWGGQEKEKTDVLQDLESSADLSGTGRPKGTNQSNASESAAQPKNTENVNNGIPNVKQDEAKKQAIPAAPSDNGDSGSQGNSGGSETPNPSEPSESVVTTYTVKFDANEGTNAPADQTVNSGEQIKEAMVSAPTRNEFDFTGWYTDKGGKELYQFGQSVTQNLILYAGWSPIHTGNDNGVKYVYSPWKKTLTISPAVSGTSIALPDYEAGKQPWVGYVSEMERVVLKDGITAIGDKAFSGCSRLSSVTILDGVTSIGDSAFYRCSSLNSITIPDNVTSIGDAAFRNCSSLSNVMIPDNVTSIGNNAFAECRGLRSVTIGNSVTSIGSSTFSYCESLRSVTIPDSVTSIGGSAFSLCRSLSNVTIGNSVTSIGSFAFNYCTSLGSVTIPDSVTSIGGSAFYRCNSLSSVTIGNSVTSIGSYAFDGCINLSAFTVPAGNTKFSVDDAGVLFDKNKTELIYYPARKTDKIYNIPNSVTGIGDSAFYGCSNLSSVTIPDSVTSIGNYAFQYCGSLSGVTIGNSVESIGIGAFSDCSGLTSVTIPASVTSIGNGAFDNCYQLKDVHFVGTEAEWTSKGWGTTVFNGKTPHFNASYSVSPAMALTEEEEQSAISDNDKEEQPTVSDNEAEE